MLDSAKIKCLHCNEVTQLVFSEIVTCEGCGAEEIIDSGLHMTLKIEESFSDLMENENVVVSCYIYPFIIQKLDTLKKKYRIDTLNPYKFKIILEK